MNPLAELREGPAYRVRVNDRWEQRSNGRQAKVIKVTQDDPLLALVQYSDGSTNWIPFTGIIDRWKPIAP